MGSPVVHFEIRSADPDASRAFYGKLFGWTFPDGGMPGYSYVDPGVDGTIPGGIGPVQGGIHWSRSLSASRTWRRPFKRRRRRAARWYSRRPMCLASVSVSSPTPSARS
jgi:catechol 2,3-dioxygenase-like lactoylglutathione lyase family enzyme